MSIQRSVDRARVYRMLAGVFQPPERMRLEVLRSEDLPTAMAALARLGCPREFSDLAEHLFDSVRVDLKLLKAEYEKAFEPSAGAERPPNETAYAPRTPQEGLTRTFEMADIAGFYRAFGVEVTPGTERVDHISAELEFMHLLAVKEAAAEDRGQADRAELCREAGAAFLHDHLGRWCPRLRDRLAENAGEIYKTAGELLARFVEHDAAHSSTATTRPN